MAKGQSRPRTPKGGGESRGGTKICFSVRVRVRAPSSAPNLPTLSKVGSRVRISFARSSFLQENYLLKRFPSRRFCYTGISGRSCKHHVSSGEDIEGYCSVLWAGVCGLHGVGIGDRFAWIWEELRLLRVARRRGNGIKFNLLGEASEIVATDRDHRPQIEKRRESL